MVSPAIEKQRSRREMDPKSWPSEYTITTSSNWVEQVPRPKEGDCHPTALARRQEQWDTAHARHEKMAQRAAEIAAEREAKLRESQERQATERRARDQAKVAAMTAELRRGYFAVPGATEDAFQAALPDLMEARRREAAMRGDDAARQSQAGLYRSF
jgi:hypothetical protein